MEIKTILCPIDFSSITPQVLDLAGRMCSLFGSNLVVQHNIEVIVMADVPLEVLPLPDYLDEEYAEKKIGEFTASVPDSISRVARVTRGFTERAILKLSEELSADLIIMGTHGRGGLKHMLIGSTTEQILADSSRPVLAVRGSEDYKRFPETDSGIRTLRPEVVVPLDFSPRSLYTLEHAYRLATIMPITLHLLHVVQPISWDDMHGMGHFNVPEFQRSRILEAKERLRLLIPQDLAGRVQVHVRMGPVVAEITGLAEAIQAGLIVMGITPGGIIEDLLFGAVAYGVLRGSPCPVWVVPGGHAQRDRIRHEERRFSDIPQTLLKTN